MFIAEFSQYLRRFWKIWADSSKILPTGTFIFKEAEILQTCRELSNSQYRPKTFLKSLKTHLTILLFRIRPGVHAYKSKQKSVFIEFL
jgi:hypothetical protein